MLSSRSAIEPEPEPELEHVVDPKKSSLDLKKKIYILINFITCNQLIKIN